MRVVTAGTPYMDIDAYGCSVALAELYRLQGEPAVATSSSPWNSSIPPEVQAWNAPFTPGYKPAPSDRFTLVDISDPEFFDPLVDHDRIEAIFDHHPGAEVQWTHKLGAKARIEPIGAACTLVYEAWTRADKLAQLSPVSARLLVCGILDNTLNLKANITTDRDRAAYHALLPISGLDEDWPAHYFKTCQDYILEDLGAALRDDTKNISYPGRAGTVRVGQLAVWDTEDILETKPAEIRRVLDTDGPKWLLNLIDIAHTRSVFWCEDAELKQWYSALLGITFTGNRATAERAWLRKEIMKKAIEKEET